MEIETTEFSIQEVIDNIYRLRQKAKELGIIPTQYVVQVRPDIYDMIDKLAQINGITLEEAWFKLLNNEFEGEE